MENNELIRMIAQYVRNAFRIEMVYLHTIGKRNIYRMTEKRRVISRERENLQKKTEI